MDRNTAALKKPRKRIKFELFDVVILFIMTLYVFIVFYPFYNSVLSSFVTAKQYALQPAMIWPPSFIVDNYNKILFESNVLIGYRNTLMVVLTGVPYSMFLIVSTAYVLSRPKLRGKRFFLVGAIFTMFFGGGLVPIYINIMNLGLMGSLASVVLMFGLNTYYMIIIKSAFEQVPESMEDAAKIDGANDLRIFFQIMLPLVLPTLATFTLFVTVDRWNEWYFSMLFIKQGNRQPLQAILRTIIAEASMSGGGALMASKEASPNVYADGIKMASVVVTMAPIMLAYPFIQKYFVKGIMLGAVKM